MCVRLKKSPFLATNTHRTVKQGPAKENKFNTVVCKSVNQIFGQRNHSLTSFFFTERAGPYPQELYGAGRTMGWKADWTRKSTIRPKSRISLKQISKKKKHCFWERKYFLSMKRSPGLTRRSGVLCDMRIPVRDTVVVRSDIEYRWREWRFLRRNISLRKWLGIHNAMLDWSWKYSRLPDEEMRQLKMRTQSRITC